MSLIQPDTGSEPGRLRLTARQHIRRQTGAHGWQAQEHSVVWPASHTALIIVDMWDRHWSRGATNRVNKKMCLATTCRRSITHFSSARCST
jgi:hypothetical protein